MPVLWILLVGVGYLALLAVTLFVVRRRSVELRPDKVAESVGLPLIPGVDRMIASIQGRELRAMYLGLTAGLVLASAGMLMIGVKTLAEVFWIDFTVTLAAAGIASVIATVAREDARQKSAVRFARLRAVTVSDYRSPFDQWVPRIVVLLAVVTLVLRALLSREGASGIPAIVYGYLAVTVLSLTVSEIGSRAVVRSGQPAVSALELAWDDALKSRVLAALVVAPFYLGAYFGIATLVLDPQTVPTLGQLVVDTQLGASGIALILLLVSATMSQANKQRYLRRLWPKLVAADGGATTSSTPAAQS
jgi:hypothetical protein